MVFHVERPWNKQRLKPESATAYVPMTYVCAREAVPRFPCFRRSERGGSVSLGLRPIGQATPPARVS
jgi:hypothetical protein